VSTTISQSTGSTVYTITPSGTTCSGSVGLPTINSLSANPSSITAGQSSLLSWTVTNASTTSLDNGIGNVSNETSTSVSPSQTTTYTLTAANGSGSSTTAQATVTVTASSDGSGSGGGGGGSVGVAASYGAPGPVESPSATGTLLTASSSVATTPISSGISSVTLEAQLQSLLALLATLEAQAAKQGIATPSVTVTPVLFTKTLYLGVSGSDVTRLQEFLAEDPAIYPEDKITGYFGTLTLEAVQRFQKKYGIANVGNPGYGHVGPLTRAKLNGLIEQGTTA
jgi:peptidoglycan hydrolase-like protein with peptidoglycan-binding domain